MAYQMVLVPMTLSKFEGHLCYLKPLFAISYINCDSITIYLHKLESARSL